MAELAKDLIDAKVKLEDDITALVNRFQKDSGVEVRWAQFNRRDGSQWPVPVFYTSLDLSLSEPKDGGPMVG